MGAFETSVEATIARWHGIAPPNDPARRLAAELADDHRGVRGAARHTGLRGRAIQLRSGACRRQRKVRDDRPRRSHAGPRPPTLVATGEATSLGSAARLLGQPRCGQSAGQRGDLAGARSRRSRCPRCRRSGSHQADAGSAARRADGAQGHVLPGRQAEHLRLGAAQGFPARRHRHRDRAHGGGRRLHVRRPEHGRVRAEPDRPQQDVRRLPQSVEPALHHRRLVLRVRRVGGGAVQLHGAGFGYRRLDPAARVGLRRHRDQADADAGVALRRDAVVVLARQCRPAGPHRARLRPRDDGDRRARPARSDQRAGAGARLRSRDGRRPARPAHRRADQRLPRRRRCAGGGGDGGGAGGPEPNAAPPSAASHCR